MSDKVKLHLLAFATIILWALPFTITKMVSMDPLTIGIGRCFFAAAFLIVLGAVRRIRLPRSIKDAGVIALAGVLGYGIYMMCFNTGVVLINSTTSSLIIALTPVLTAFGASLIYGEKLTGIGYLTIVTAFCGVAVMLLWSGDLVVNRGALWLLASALLFVCYQLLTRKLQKDGYTSMEIVTYAMIAGAVVQVPFHPQWGGEFLAADTTSQLIVFFLGAGVSAVSYVLWARAFSYAENTSEVTNYMFVTPFVTAVMGFALLGEVPDAGTIIGGAIIIASVVIFAFKGK